MLLLLLSVQRVRRDNQVFDLFGWKFSSGDLHLVAGVHGSVVGEAARAVGRVNVRFVAARFPSNKKCDK
jgi:hypothetical protein